MVTHTIKYVDISSKSDLSRYLGLAEVITTPNLTKYKTTMAPTNRYRIKTRGAFGTNKDNHYADPKTEAAGWIPLKEVIWK